jgi:quinol monooxygenase YgiN
MLRVFQKLQNPLEPCWVSSTLGSPGRSTYLSVLRTCAVCARIIIWDLFTNVEWYSIHYTSTTLTAFVSLAYWLKAMTTIRDGTSFGSTYLSVLRTCAVCARIIIWDLFTNVEWYSIHYTSTTLTAFVSLAYWLKAMTTIRDGTSFGLKEIKNEKWRHFSCPTINI